jgi:hypothetical protein
MDAIRPSSIVTQGVHEVKDAPKPERRSTSKFGQFACKAKNNLGQNSENLIYCSKFLMRRVDLAKLQKAPVELPYI